MNEAEKLKKVLVIQRRMTHYRLAFFNSLREHCQNNGIELQVAYGTATTAENAKQDGAELSWGKKLKTHYLFDGKICWQPFARYLVDTDAVVVALENKLLYNFIPQFFYKKLKFIYWGHGANLQGNPKSLRERFKRRVARYADWWFGYTQMSVPLIERSGFPTERITVLNNSIDTAELAAQCAAVTPESQARWRNELNLTGKQVGIYIGSLYEEKRIDFLLSAAEQLQKANPDFVLLIIGGGAQQTLVEQFCATHAWAHYLGVRKGQEKVDLLSLADVMLNPGLVGLGILDSFVAGVPMLTTDCGLHSPEIAYLHSGVNGLMTANDLASYVAEVQALLADDDALARLRAGCLNSAREYTVENMARNFTQGLVQCLQQPPLRGRA
ncbi:glycosyltransferase family 4 protein [Aeromonas sp. QDB25]|uniref:glycosyltransferase family 4 protein n=1 Tax=Aeromonas sp. QDB25 TaxID=2989832 RepID=UPI0022E30C8A|nr:glycosyltransferase family 4 protein [Aeromonas sp. QDB25]